MSKRHEAANNSYNLLLKPQLTPIAFSVSSHIILLKVMDNKINLISQLQINLEMSENNSENKDNIEST
jgi:hypothetical protein